MPEIRIGTDKPAEPTARTDQKATADEVLTPSDKPADKPAEEKKKYAGKYESVEELEKAYLEAQKKISTPKEPEKPAVDVAAKAIEQTGLDLATLNAELADNDGKLTEKTLKSLKAKGISGDLATAFVEGQKARVVQLQATLAETVGGAEQLGELIQWAASGVPKEVAAMFNAAVDSGNTEGAKMILQGIQQRHTAAVGKDPKFVGGAQGGGRGDGAQAFKSNMEVVRAMNDPRYAIDPAYRKDVENRLAASSSFGL